MRLWDKGAPVDEQMMRFTARDDWQLDEHLLPYDLRATIAHVRMLAGIDVLTAAERDELVRTLTDLTEEQRRGEFHLDASHEDGHSAIEIALTERLGDLGKKVHTGRSRNDQVLVATRLYQRDRLDALVEATREAGRAMLAMARAHRDVPMAGYTHLQRAVPSTVGHWAGSFAEGFAEAIACLSGVRPVVDQCPLGSAAGFGVNLPLDRQAVARELGFGRVHINPMACQSSRGTTEVVLLSAAWHGSATLRRLAWDLSLFSTSEFGFVSLDAALTTGSSIMPQKRNPDLCELLRASTSVVQGAVMELMGMVALPPGYHRDLQLTKAPMMRGLEEALSAMLLVPRLAEGITWNETRMRESITPECYATDRAVELAVAGVPFRDAYRDIAKSIEAGGDRTPEESIGKRTSYGSPGHLDLDAIEAHLEQV